MSGPYKTLRRPIGGWHARQWRRDAASGLVAAWLVIGSWASIQTAVALLKTVVELLR